MGIYRGAGGTGDAVNDATSQATITVLARDEAIVAKNAAQAAQTAAELAETNAETAATNSAVSAAAAALFTPSQTGNSGKYLKTDGTNTAWDDLNISTADISGVLPAVNGGTGQSSYAVGDLVYASTTTALSKLADVATGNVVISGGVGVAPSYGKVALTTHVSGVLPVANGGTNASTAGITSFNNITGYTAAGATGTTSTNLVFSTSPTLVTPNLGTPSAAVLTSATGLPLTTGVTGTLPLANGGTGATTDATARTALGATTLGANLFTITNPSAITFPRYNADNTVSALDAATFRTAIGAGTSSTTGTVTSVAALTLGTTGTDLSSTVATGTTTPVITLQVPTASASNRGALSAADWTTFNNKGSGTVTSVTGTAPVVSSGGTTPAISMAAATTSVSGYLTSTDWTTFNNKGSGSVTSVSVSSANGFAGTVATGTTTPAITVSTSITGVLKGNGTAISAATVGTDYSAGTSANTSGLVYSTTTTGALTTATGAQISSALGSTAISGNAATATSATTATNLASGANLQIPYQTSSGATSFIAAPTISSTYLQYNGTGFAWASSAGIGTVTSVAQSFTGGLISVSGSPITTAGTLALTVAGTSGGVPYFSSSSAWASSAALTQYGVVYGGGAGAAPVATAAGTTGQVLTATTSGAPTWATPASASFPSGTAMLFVQTSAPTGWTKLTNNDNKALRVVSGTAGTGGSVAFTTAFASGSTGAYTLATADIPSHSHLLDIAGGAGNPERFYADTWGGSTSITPNLTSQSTGGGGSHSHSLSLAVQYVDVIIATKD
ncbi:hypothetical protein UFOVP507_38 [uncultured Caudovirales phage]|uniref:Uncharacterized protein n=1 Tax=uncultured Caudovirales phage TaxID=2100421 RepID=A0A6J5MVD2_9CAUD|nr:hypothetical protein UFOVP507_38 [uncultured Caudovirales phage]